MGNPTDSQIFSLLCRLQILGEAEAEKAQIRYSEVSGGLPLVLFLLDGGYLGRSQLLRLKAMAKSDGGDLFADERAVLDYVCDKLPDGLGVEDKKDTDVRRGARSQTFIEGAERSADGAGEIEPG